MSKTAVIILTWNGMKYLPDCFESLIKQDYPQFNREIIIVDNASTDGTIEYIKKNYPQFTLIKNDKNYGFDKGNNIGMRYALDKGYEYIVLLNQDTAVDTSWLSELVKTAESDKKIGGAQSLMLYFENSNIRKCESESARNTPPISPPYKKGERKVNSWGNELHFLGFGFCKGNGETTPSPSLSRRGTVNTPPFYKGGQEGVKDITYASCASVLYRASVLREVGCFDEEFFLYHEDTDLSFKIKMAGYKVVFAPKSIMYHKYEFSRSIKKYYYMERNRYRILLTYLKLPTLILIFPAFIAMECGMWLFAFRGGWAKEKILAYGYMLNPRNLADIYKKRRDIMRTRKLSDREFAKNFVGEIMYQEIDNPLLRYIANPSFRVYWAVVRSVIFW